MAAKHMVRIDAETHAALSELRSETGQTMSDLLAMAVKRLEHELFIERLNEGYARLRADEKAWKEELAERELWDTTLGDGLEPY